MVVFIVRPWKRFMARTDTEYQTANKPLKFVTATKSVAFTRTRFARLLAGRYAVVATKHHSPVKFENILQKGTDF